MSIRKILLTHINSTTSTLVYTSNFHSLFPVAFFLLSYRNLACLAVISIKLNVILFLYLQIEEALVRRKKMELLQKYASETLMAQSEEAKTLLGL